MKKRIVKPRRIVKSRGFGDDIAKFTKATGIDRGVKRVTKFLGIEDCGCEERQKKLNDPKLLVNRVFHRKK